jgi:hypothetical protein
MSRARRRALFQVAVGLRRVLNDGNPCFCGTRDSVMSTAAQKMHG